jgi:hypothetical protein
VSGRDTALKRAKAIREVMLDYGVPEVGIGGLLPGRPGPADVWNGLDPVGELSHHIASRPTPENPTPGLALVRQGRDDLEGPLCNGTAGVDLVYRIVTLGWANHPGFGGPLTLRGPLGAFTVPRDNGRPYLWGTEYEGGFSEAVWDQTYTNRRTGKKMTFREFMGRSNAALAEAIWLPGVSSRGLHDRIDPGMDLSGYHGEHKTWAPDRKIDRLNYTTNGGRAEIRRAKELTAQEEDMHYGEWPKEVQRKMAQDVAAEVMRQTIKLGDDKEINVRQALRRSALGPAVTRDQTAPIDAALAEVLTDLDEIQEAIDPGEAPAG